MKKFGLLLLGGVAAIILLANVGPLVGLVISLAIMYYAFKGFMKTNSTVSKVFWAIFGLIAFAATASNVPAIVAVVAAYVLYIVYKKLKQTDEVMVEKNDPFTNFEKEWAKLNRN
ncbi:flagellar basal body rod protein [Bacillus salitolerans]|uniref:Flagellar basal body rod protein n=1 Tax=Bacillus salitolerans TaxID=1437434 RepID=A0ABW4LXC1_9BACI